MAKKTKTTTRSCILKQNKSLLKIMLEVEFYDGEFQLRSWDRYKTSFFTMFACAEEAKKYVPKRLLEIMKKKKSKVELTISTKPIDHTFIANIGPNGFAYREPSGDGDIIWQQAHKAMGRWAKRNRIVGKEVYFLFEVV